MKALQRPSHHYEKMQKQPTAVLASEVAGQARLRNRTRSISETAQRDSDPNNHRHSIAGTNQSQEPQQPVVERKAVVVNVDPPAKPRVPEKTPLFIRKFTQRKKKDPHDVEDEQLAQSREELRKELIVSVGKFQHHAPLQKTLSGIKSTERKRQFSLPHSCLAERNSKERVFRTAGGAEGFDRRFTIDEEDEASVEDDSRGTTAELPVAQGGLDPRTSDINQRSLKLLLSPNTRRRLFSGHGNPEGDSDRNVNSGTKRSLCASASAQEPLEGTNQASPSNTIFSATKSATLSLWSALVSRSNSAFSRFSQNNQPSENEDSKIKLPSGVDPSHTKSTGSEGVAEKV